MQMTTTLNPSSTAAAKLHALGVICVPAFVYDRRPTAPPR